MKISNQFKKYGFPFIYSILVTAAAFGYTKYTVDMKKNHEYYGLENPMATPPLDFEKIPPTKLKP